MIGEEAQLLRFQLHDDDGLDGDDDSVDDDDDNDDDSGTTGCPDGAGRFPCCISFIFVTLIFVMKYKNKYQKMSRATGRPDGAGVT